MDENKLIFRKNEHREDKLIRKLRFLNNRLYIKMNFDKKHLEKIINEHRAEVPEEVLPPNESNLNKAENLALREKEIMQKLISNDKSS